MPDFNGLLAPVEQILRLLQDIHDLLDPPTLVRNAILTNWDSLLRTIRAFALTTGDAQHPFTESHTIRTVEPMVRAVANLGLVAVVGFGSFRIMWAHGSRTIYSVRILLPRLMLAVILINFAIPLFQAAVDVNNALANTVLAAGLPLSADTFRFDLSLDFGSGPGLTLVTTAALFLGYVVLAFVYVVRYALLVVLAITAPLAGLLFVLPDTHHYAKSWSGLFVPTLLMQPLQLLILSIGFHLDGETTWPIRHAFALAALFLAFKVPGALHTSASAGRHASSTLKRHAHHAVHAALKA